MFTGIIERTGTIVETLSAKQGRRIRVRLSELADTVRAGDSIAIDGVCLTATELDGKVVSFDVVGETLRNTTLGRLATDDEVNLERSVQAGSTMDGHFVQGHVDGVGVVAEMQDRADDRTITIAVSSEIEPLMVHKGSVAVDGVSLTIAGVQPGRFTVALIPTTLQRTTIGRRRVGDEVNIETDILARTVLHMLQRDRTRNGITVERLAADGYA